MSLTFALVLGEELHAAEQTWQALEQVLLPGDQLLVILRGGQDGTGTFIDTIVSRSPVFASGTELTVLRLDALALPAPWDAWPLILRQAVGAWMICLPCGAMPRPGPMRKLRALLARETPDLVVAAFEIALGAQGATGRPAPDSDRMVPPAGMPSCDGVSLMPELSRCIASVAWLRTQDISLMGPPEPARRWPQWEALHQNAGASFLFAEPLFLRPPLADNAAAAADLTAQRLRQAPKTDWPEIRRWLQWCDDTLCTPPRKAEGVLDAVRSIARTLRRRHRRKLAAQPGATARMITGFLAQGEAGLNAAYARQSADRAWAATQTLVEENARLHRVIHRGLADPEMLMTLYDRLYGR